MAAIRIDYEPSPLAWGTSASSTSITFDFGTILNGETMVQNFLDQIRTMFSTMETSSTALLGAGGLTGTDDGVTVPNFDTAETTAVEPEQPVFTPPDDSFMAYTMVDGKMVLISDLPPDPLFVDGGIPTDNTLSNVALSNDAFMANTLLPDGTIGPFSGLPEDPLFASGSTVTDPTSIVTDAPSTPDMDPVGFAAAALVATDDTVVPPEMLMAAIPPPPTPTFCQMDTGEAVAITPAPTAEPTPVLTIADVLNTPNPIAAPGADIPAPAQMMTAADFPAAGSITMAPDLQPTAVAGSGTQADLNMAMLVKIGFCPDTHTV